MRERNRALVELQQARDDLTSLIIRDLRSPLTAIIGYLALLRLNSSNADHESLLLQMSRPPKARLFRPAGGPPEVRFTHEALAEIVETYRETATKILGEFRAQGLMTSGAAAWCSSMIRGCARSANGSRARRGRRNNTLGAITISRTFTQLLQVVRRRIASAAILFSAALMVACADGAPGAAPATVTPPVAVESTTAPLEAQRYSDILDVTLTRLDDGAFTVTVTVSLSYDTPDRYADAWRVLAPDGAVLAVREPTHDPAYAALRPPQDAPAQGLCSSPGSCHAPA